MAFNVSSLPNYVEQRRLPLVSRTLLGSNTTKYATIQTDVKHQSVINIVGTNLALGDGAACGWSETGTTDLTQRTITAGDFKVNLAFCDKVLLNKWAGYEVRVAAGEKRLPFEEEFVNEVIGKLSEQVDKVVWLGNTSPAASGILTEWMTATSTTTLTTAATADAAVAALLASSAYAKISGESDVVIFCSPAFYTAYVQSLVAKNLYHYDPKDGTYVQIPGTNIELVPTAGLSFYSSPVAFLARRSNVFVGVDMVNDNEKFELWYSQDNREFRLAIEFAIGGQVAFPDEAMAISL